jgi:O-antigen ligase
MVQATGTFDHQNILGMPTHFVIFPFLALLLVRRHGPLPPAVLIAGMVVQVLTASRGTLGFSALGYVALSILSVLRRRTSRKRVIIFAGATMIALAAPLALSSIAERGLEEMRESTESRVPLEAAAAAMLWDHPLGVGSNNFVVAANTQGYYQRVGTDTYGAVVHNIYWLVAAETGYLGIVAFVLLLLRPLALALPFAVRHRGDERGDLILGLGTALLVVYTHSLFEWVLITTEIQYFFSTVRPRATCDWLQTRSHAASGDS